MLHLDERYYTFSQAGWQFVVLDSTHDPQRQKATSAKLDDAAIRLARQRRSATRRPTTPVLIVSHIPILSASAILWAEG